MTQSYCPAARLHAWARPLVVTLSAVGAWNQSVILAGLGVIALSALIWHSLKGGETDSRMLNSERGMVAEQGRMEHCLTALAALLLVTVLLHLLWMHQLRLALMIATTASCTKVVWNILHVGKPGFSASITTLAGLTSLMLATSV
ncbi:hypothetical protein [Ferrimonas gelatinilytica]|uniref:Uncharacterized protein n=1 Tax=Ferrimonas gelatinilytica TaxID=1255257 RepID=A0ABP9SA43_9GAMM